MTSESTDIRLQKHLSDYYKKPKFTNCASDWTIFWSLDCPSLVIARKIERHIKNMKSRKYLLDLKMFPEIEQKLIIKYAF
jgi:putative endonuclease